MCSKNFKERCEKAGINLASVSFNRAKFILIHHHLESDFFTISGFADDENYLKDISQSSEHYGSLHHDYIVCPNDNEFSISDKKCIKDVKDSVLINLCNNVGQYLDIFEFAMLKKSFDKSLQWFERAKDSCCLASYILENY